MFNIFGRCNSQNGESSTMLWFIILVILLFMNNDNCDSCSNKC